MTKKDWDATDLLHTAANVPKAACAASASSAASSSQSSFDTTVPEIIAKRLKTLVPELHETPGHPLRMQWQFNNECVAYHRWLVAHTHSHAAQWYTNWDFPEYLSTAPLPTHAKTLACEVRMAAPPDPEIVPNAPQPRRDAVTVTKIGVGVNDRCEKLIAKATAKFGLNGSVSDYALKVSGRKEYMDGRRLLFQYDHVRKCIRDSKQLTLMLVHRPTIVAVNAHYVKRSGDAFLSNATGRRARETGVQAYHAIALAAVSASPSPSSLVSMSTPPPSAKQPATALLSMYKLRQQSIHPSIPRVANNNSSGGGGSGGGGNGAASLVAPTSWFPSPPSTDASIRAQAAHAHVNCLDEPQWLPMTDLQHRWRACIVGLDNVTTSSLPRTQAMRGGSGLNGK
jgi:hypothetical protein